MRERTKSIIKTTLLSNFNNDTAIECAKNNPVWIGVLLGLVGIILPVIPILTTTLNTYGSQPLKTYKYGLERFNTSIALDLYSKGYEFKVNGSNELIRYKDSAVAPQTEETEPISSYVSVGTSDAKTVEFTAYYSERNASSVKTLINTLDAITYVGGTDQVVKPDESYPEGSTFYRPSYMLLYKDGIYVYLNNRTTSKKIATIGGDWKHTAKDSDIFTSLLTVGDTLDGFDPSDVDGDGHFNLLRDTDYVNSVQKNFEKLYNDAYLTTKHKTILTYTLMFFGIYFALIVLMGLLIFILTRGKKNPMNYLSYWTCTKIAMWSAFAPGLLAMVMGFLLANFATMFFIILYGLRVMWLSMKNLRPANNYSR